MNKDLSSFLGLSISETEVVEFLSFVKIRLEKIKRVKYSDYAHGINKSLGD